MKKNNENIIESTFMDTQSASRYLGLSHSSIYKYTKNGILPFYKPTSKLIFKKEDLEKFILEKKK